MTQDDHVPSNSTASASTTPHSSTTPVPGSEELPVNSPKERPLLTDTLAAVTIAILAVILVITLTLIVRAVRRRQRAERGEELGHIPTVSAGIVSASVAAYSRGQRSRRQEGGVISWEPVTPTSSSADVVPSTSSLSSSRAGRAPPSIC